MRIRTAIALRVIQHKRRAACEQHHSFARTFDFQAVPCSADFSTFDQNPRVHFVIQISLEPRHVGVARHDERVIADDFRSRRGHARKFHRKIQPALRAAGQPLNEHAIRRAGKDFALKFRLANGEFNTGQRRINVQPARVIRHRAVRQLKLEGQIAERLVGSVVARRSVEMGVGEILRPVQADPERVVAAAVPADSCRRLSDPRPAAGRRSRR